MNLGSWNSTSGSVNGFATVASATGSSAATASSTTQTGQVCRACLLHFSCASLTPNYQVEAVATYFNIGTPSHFFFFLLPSEPRLTPSPHVKRPETKVLAEQLPQTMTMLSTSVHKLYVSHPLGFGGPNLMPSHRQWGSVAKKSYLCGRWVSMFVPFSTFTSA